VDAILNDAVFWQWVGRVIGAALTLAVVSFLLRYTSRDLRTALYNITHYTPQVIERVDEPTDPWIVLLDRYIPGKADTILSVALPEFLRALSDVLKSTEPSVADVSLERVAETTENLDEAVK